MTHNLHIFDIIYYLTFCPIRHFVIRRFVPFDILAFDILSHSMLFLFDNLSHSMFCPVRHFLRSIFCSFDVLSHSIFCLLDILSHSTFWHSAFCPIRRFVVRRFVHSAFVTSTFCRWTYWSPGMSYMTSRRTATYTHIAARFRVKLNYVVIYDFVWQITISGSLYLIISLSVYFCLLFDFDL